MGDIIKMAACALVGSGSTGYGDINDGGTS